MPRSSTLRQAALGAKEDVRLSIQREMDEFQASGDATMAFPVGLTSQERAAVHAECQKRGLRSKSFGKGAQRQVHVFKPITKLQKNVSDISIENQAMEVLVQHVQNFPPSQNEIEAAAGGGNDQGLYAISPMVGSRKGGGRKKSSVDTVQSKLQGRALAADMHRRIAMDAEAKTLSMRREELPIHAFRDAITQAVEKNQVVLVAGETGCGKTTQVPQFLVDHCWANDRTCQILCTQPRRISAMTIAERVARERADKIGQGIGYQIRLETRVGPDTYITFCTNGILLRKLTLANRANALEGFTHIIIDEVHERDRFADFLLIILRDLLPSMPHLRVVLMSATLNAEAFMKYFACPIIRVPGFVHPVEEFYLEDVLHICCYTAEGCPPPRPATSSTRSTTLRSTCKSDLDKAKVSLVQKAIKDAFLSGDNQTFTLLISLATEKSGLEDFQDCPFIDVQHFPTGTTALMAAAGKGRLDAVTELINNGANTGIKSSDGSTARDWALRFGFEDVANVLESIEEQVMSLASSSVSAVRLSQYQLRNDPDDVDLNLICALIDYITREVPLKGKDKDGAILVFLPGWDEILRLKDMLGGSDNPLFKRLLVLPLHSMISPDEQRKAFKRPPKGLQKVVLSTNIAETAITIDDVVYVINSGRLKEKSYDPYTGVSTLQSQWHSKASEKQRRGRAGRCRPGQCFYLYSKSRSESFSEFAVPELRRSPLEELALQVKLLQQGALADSVKVPSGIGGIESFLKLAIEPPMSEAITSAVQLLIDIGALTSDEDLTFLGSHLANLPLPPQVGKMLLFAILFGCLDPVLTLACGTAYRDPFVTPTDARERQRANDVRQHLDRIGGGYSDHLILVAAYEGWLAAKSHGKEYKYCKMHFLSPGTMQIIEGMRKQLIAELKDTGMVRNLDDASRNSHNRDIVRNVICSGMYPMYGTVLPQKTAQKDNRSMLCTRRGEKVMIHPQSINKCLRRKEDDPPLLAVFDEMVRGDSRLFIRSSTLTTLHFLFFVAASLRIAEDEEFPEGKEEEESMQEELQTKETCSSDHAILVLDSWLACRVPIAAVAPLSVLRLRIATAFAKKVQSPRSMLPQAMEDALRAVSILFTLEPLPQSSNKLNQADTFQPKEIYAGGTPHPKGGHHSPSLQKLPHKGKRSKKTVHAPGNKNPIHSKQELRQHTTVEKATKVVKERTQPTKPELKGSSNKPKVPSSQTQKRSQ